jgi:hypothetical protein
MEISMAPEDRDRSFDKALSRHLRAAAAAGQGASADQSPSSRPASCLDSETLAAYHERSLHPEEMDSCKEHIVACAHCQAILAEIEATEAIPLPALEKEEVLELGSAKYATAVGGRARTAAAAPFPEKSRAARLARGVSWRWLAPAGALAAGLLVWIAWHENQPRLVSAPESQVAKLEQPPAPEPAPLATGHATPSSPAADQIVIVPKDRELVGGLASAKKVPAPENLKQFEKLDSRARSASAKPLASDADKERGARDARRESAQAADRIQNEPSPEAKGVATGAAASEAVEVQVPTPNVPAQNQNLQNQQNQQNQLNEQKVAGPSPLGQAKETKKAKSESSAHLYRSGPPPQAPPSQAPTPAPSVALSDVSAAPAAIAGSAPPYLIFVPGTQSLWRVGHAGLIEFSSDGGTSWVRQASNVVADLTSGSSPSPKVCWVVGRAGTILLTADAGEHWSVIHSPVTEDLEIVNAFDALHAIVICNHGFKAFETKDGGKTWTQWVAQE